MIAMWQFAEINPHETHTMSQYRYHGQPLAAGVAQHLILDTMRGRLAHISEFTKEVVALHRLRDGSSQPEHRNAASIRRALRALKGKGDAENPSHGYWRVLGEVGSAVGDLVNELQLMPPPLCAELLDEGSTSLEHANYPLVDGPVEKAVYVYYYPAYRELSRLKGGEFWHCKIGGTEKGLENRIHSQSPTSQPERPHLALVLKFEKPFDFESALHFAFAARNRHIKSAPGVEWFWTNPDEILTIALALVPDVSYQLFAPQEMCLDLG